MNVGVNNLVADRPEERHFLFFVLKNKKCFYVQ